MIKRRAPYFDNRNGNLLANSFADNCYWLYEDLFSKEEVEYIHKVFDDKSRHDATVGSGSEKELNTIVRKSRVSFHSDEDLNSLLNLKIGYAIQQANWKYDITLMESPQYTIYNADGSHYEYHVDNFNNAKESTIRKISCSILLSDSHDYQGGQFQFIQYKWSRKDNKLISSPITISNLKSKGSALLFPSFTYHRVLPVTKGIRKSLVIWLRGPDWK